ncbi:hypothetical protein HRE60_09095 [Streptococcus salivarius]|uniref:Uncharacterized protein n=1 Tax=Streptococcus salivarius TaxID=1304 RepID=A0A7L6WNE8_STRSL|nr:hypothetical protein [Streptococcus salivarius]QMI51800.1 hypothetical protein HRE60_09095 [Streptococcus salivarius]
MVLDRYQAIIKEHAKNFKVKFGSNFIEGNYRKNVRDKSRYTSDFPLFNIAPDNFYIYQIYVKDLQSNIRNCLINPILEELLNESGYKITSSLKDIRRCVGFSNSAIEEYNHYPFQFIIEKENSRIGVRYTGLYDIDDVVRELLKDFQIDKVIILHFSKDMNIVSNSYSKIIDISHYSIKNFLDEFINENIYQYFLTTLTKAIDDMQELIGFDVIPRLSMSNLAKVRLDLRENLQNVNLKALSYNSQKNFNNLEECDLDIINSNLEKGKAEVLLGKSDFATSYLTSEYLYKVLVDNSNFDYTSVVAGYLKTIEQFLYRLLEYQMNTNESKNWIKTKNHYQVNKEFKAINRTDDIKSNGHKILAKSQYLDYMDTSLGSLINYMNDNKDCLEISKDGKKILKELLDDYKTTVRNGYFHKHNLEDIEEVKRIRNNTLYLLCFLIGSLKDFDITKFGWLDFSFNDFYHKVPRLSINIPFYIQEMKNSQPKLMKLVYEQESESYNVDGLLENNLYFAEVDYPNKRYEYINQVPKDDLVIFNTNNVPYRAEYVGRSTDDGFINKVEFYRKD